MDQLQAVVNMEKKPSISQKTGFCDWVKLSPAEDGLFRSVSYLIKYKERNAHGPRAMVRHAK
jgi:hypothetical protein